MFQDKLQKPQQVYDVIRKGWFVATAEELFRQRLIHYMINELSYPQHFIVVEKALKELPHRDFSMEKPPERRVDIICFAKGVHSRDELYPLIAIECKAVKITEKAFHQIEGYNHYLQAYYISLINEREVYTGCLDPLTGKYCYTKTLPSFPELKMACQNV